MLQRIGRLLRQECGIQPGEVVVVGVSGGPDSLCLLHALYALGHRPIVAHFDHQLRPESSSDAAHVAKFASSLGLQFMAGTESVSAYSAAKGISVEEAARILRYTFLFGQARSHGTVAVAVGHTADDQAETILMHILRGAGVSGLGGMSHRVVLPEFDDSIPIIRPLLESWREQTLEYCRLHELPILHDASNELREFLRNRLRLDLIPSLKAYNPQIRQALWRLGSSAIGDMALIDHLVAVAWKRTVIFQDPQYVGFDAAKVAAEPGALQRRLIMRAALSIQPDSELDFEAMRQAERFISEGSGRRLQLGGGLLLSRESKTVFLSLGERTLPTDSWPQLPGENIAFGRERVVSAQLGGTWRFTAELSGTTPEPSDTHSAPDPYRGVLDADSLPLELELRVPRPGDRIQPIGLQGHSQKLSDVFNHIGVPKRLRQHWPVLASDNVVVWVPGFRIAEPYRIRTASRRAVLVGVYRLTDG